MKRKTFIFGWEGTIDRAVGVGFDALPATGMGGGVVATATGGDLCTRIAGSGYSIWVGGLHLDVAGDLIAEEREIGGAHRQ